MSGFVHEQVDGVDVWTIVRNSAPGPALEYWLDWGSWLPPGEGIATAVWEIPAPLTLDGSVIDGTKARVWVSGAADPGQDLTGRCTVTTDGSPASSDTRSLVFRIRRR